MSIQNLSTDMSQSRIQENAAVMVQSKALQNMKQTGADLNRLMESAKISSPNTITDPSKGSYINILA